MIRKIFWIGRQTDLRASACNALRILAIVEVSVCLSHSAVLSQRC